MSARLSLSGLHLQSLNGVHVNGQYRYVPVHSGDDRRGEGCTVLALAREVVRGPVRALVEFADLEQRVVPWASLRSFREKYPLTPVDLGT